MSISKREDYEAVLCSIVKLYSNGTQRKEIIKAIKSEFDIKISNTTLSRHLRRKIKLRSISETLKLQNRKNWPIGDIISLYLNKKTPIIKLSKLFFISQNTIKKILLDNNIPLMSRGEINHLFRTKFIKPKLSLDKKEKAYMIGLVVGDFAVYIKSKFTLRITTATTIQSFVDMNYTLFNNYGHFMKAYDKYNQCWKIIVDLDLESFGFLLEAKRSCLQILKEFNENEFYYFLAGFIDAEGCISVSKRRLRNKVEFNISIYNTDISLLNMINSRLIDLKFNPKITKIRDKGSSIYHNKIFNHNYKEFRITLNKKLEIKKILEILPILHPDKIRKKKILLYSINNKIYRLDEFLNKEKLIL